MLITKQKELIDFCKKADGKEFLTVDTEFIREKTYYPKLCLIQVGLPDGTAVAVDPLAEGIDLKPLLKVLTNKSCIKVFHAARQDLEIFYALTGQVLEPFFDTQIAAMVCGYGDSVGYENLVRNLLNRRMDKSSQYTNWANRPLTKRQLGYALDDVIHLIDIYKKLNQELEKQGRTEWVYQEEDILADPATYENPPEEAWIRLKVKTPTAQTLAILRSVAAWREERAQKKDIPRSWVLKDDTLIDMSAQAPQDAKQLARIRNMPEDLAKGSIGKELLKIIAKTLDSDPKDWPQPKKSVRLPSSAMATLDILRMLLKVQCAKHGVATKLVASKDDLEALATQDKPDIPAMKGWRYQIFGKDALEMKNGRLAIGLKNSKITKYKVTDKSEAY